LSRGTTRGCSGDEPFVAVELESKNAETYAKS
jgi:hypothetical protein